MEERKNNELQNAQANELQIIQAKRDAEFSLTPVGQTIKQFEVMQRMGNMYTQSTIVPDTYKGNIGNCVIALDMAMRMGCNPLMVMQNLYIVHGNPAFSSFSKTGITTFSVESCPASIKLMPRAFASRNTLCLISAVT